MKKVKGLGKKNRNTDNCMVITSGNGGGGRRSYGGRGNGEGRRQLGVVNTIQCTGVV